MVDGGDEPASTRDLVATAHDATLDPSVKPGGLPARFRVDGELGRGGMGRVFGAHDRQLSRDVAIKEIASASDPASLARFEREIRITARLQHPAIVPLYDAGYTSTGTPYYVMRRLSGRSLGDRIAEAHSLDERLALLPRFLAAADAIAYAHTRGVIHRDVKPANIVIGEHGECVVIDWGLAKDLDDDTGDERAAASSGGDGLTRHGAVMGTPGYMAPELARGEPADRRADVYALGATLCHILSGRQPLEPRAALPREVPRELVAIVEHAMAIDAGKRYGDGAGIAGDLRRFLEGQLVAAYRYSFGDRARRFVRRHVVAVTITAVALAVVATTVVLAMTSIVSARDRARAGWDRAEQRGDELLLAGAEALVVEDPARAALLAATLPLDSDRWVRARTIITAARANGIVRRVAKHAALAGALRLAPDGVRLAALDRGGGVMVHDGTGSHTIANVSGASGLAWLGDTIAIAAPDKLTLVTGGTQRTISTAGPAKLAGPSDASFLAWRDREGIFVLTPSGEPTKLVAIPDGGALDVSPDGRWIATRQPLRIFARDGTELAIPIAPDLVMDVAFSRDGTRVAACGMRGDQGLTVELELGATAITRAQWRDITVGLTYSGDVLFGIARVGNIVDLSAKAGDVRAILRSLPLARAAIPNGIAVTTGDGRVIVVERDTEPRELQAPSKLHHLTASASTLYGAAYDGSIFAWNLADVRVPAFVDRPGASAIAAIDATTIVRCSENACERTGASTPEPFAILQRGPYTLAVRLADNAVETVDSAVVAGGFIASARDRTLSLHTPFASSPPQTRAFDDDILAIAGGQHTIAVALANGRLWRRDLRSNRELTATAHVPVGALAVDGDVVYAAAGGELLRWRDRVETVAQLPSEIVAIAGDELGVTAVTRDRTVHFVSPTGALRSTKAPEDGNLVLAPRRALAAVISEDRRVVVINAAAGTTREVSAPGAIAFAFSHAGDLAVQMPGRIELVRDDLPRDPAALVRWLAAATNAELDRDLSTLRWR